MDSTVATIGTGQDKELASISLNPVIPENSVASLDIELQKMSKQESSGGVRSSVNKSEVVRNDSNDDALPLFGIHIQSTCSIDIEEFEKIDNKELAASESREAAEIAQSPKNALSVTDEGSLDEKGCNTAPASVEADKLKFSVKQSDACNSECVASSTESTSNDKTSVSDSLLENDSEFVEKTSPEKVSPNHNLETEHENSCVGNDGIQAVLNTSVDAGDSLTAGDDLQPDEKQADDCAMDIDSNSQGSDEEKPVVDSDLREKEKHLCADASNYVCRKRRDSGHNSEQVISTTVKRRPPLLSCIPQKVSKKPLLSRILSPPSGYTGYGDHYSTSGPSFHNDGMRMPFPEMCTPGIFPPAPAPSPWYGPPVEPPFSHNWSVPPPGMMFPSGMAAPPGGCLPWDGNLQPFGSVPPQAPPGYVPPGPFMAPTNVFQPPHIPPSYGVPPAPVGMAQYPSCNGMAPGFSGVSQFDNSTATPYPDQSYQEWYDWCKKYSEWIQGYNSNIVNNTEVANGSKALVSMATSKSSDSKSPATVAKPTVTKPIVTKATVVKVPLDKKPRKSVSPISLIPLPSTAEREVVKVTMSSTKPLLASAVNVETQSSNQRDVTTKAPSSNRISSPPALACSSSWKNLDVLEKNFDLSVANKTDKTDVSLGSKTAETRWLSSFKQDSVSEPEQTALSQNQPSPSGESSSWKQRLLLESKPSKPSSLSRRQNLVSLAATFNADASTAVESKVSVSPSNRMFSIGNLPVGTKATEIRAFISRYGTVVNCKVGGLRSQKDAGLFALVTMETEKDVQVCVAKLNETNFNGKQIVVAKFDQH